MPKPLFAAGLVALVVSAAAAEAFAHGGEYSAPPLYRPKKEKKLGEDGPTTGGGDLPPPLVETSTTESKLGPDEWKWWWASQRRAHLRARPVEGPITPSESAAPAPDWRVPAARALTRALDDRDDDVATAAIVALGKMGHAAFEPWLVRTLGDAARMQTAREAAACALALMPPAKAAAPGDGPPALASPSARAALESVAIDAAQQPRLRAIAVYALGLRGEKESVEILTGFLHLAQVDAQVLAASATSLGLIGTDEARTELRRALLEPREGAADPSLVRVYAAQGLVRAGAVGMVPDIRRVTDDPDPAVRRAAMLALGALANALDDPVQATLRKRLDTDPEVTCRDVAVLALGMQASPKCKSVLDDALGGGRQVHPSFAATALGMWARENPGAEATSVLRRALPTTSDPAVRGTLCVGLALAGDRAAAPLVLRIAESAGDAGARARATAAVAELATREEAGAALRRLLDSQEPPEVRREAAMALGAIGDVGAAATLQDMLERTDGVYLRAAAVVALGRVGGAASAANLVKVLEAPGQPAMLRAMAAVGLGIALDRPRDRPLHLIAADLDWRSSTEAVAEVLSIL